MKILILLASLATSFASHCTLRWEHDNPKQVSDFKVYYITETSTNLVAGTSTNLVKLLPPIPESPYNDTRARARFRVLALSPEHVANPFVVAGQSCSFDLPPGVHKFAVSAVSIDGVEGPLSETLTIRVPDAPHSLKLSGTVPENQKNEL